MAKKIILSQKSYVGLGKVPIGIGAVLRGWNITEQEFKQGIVVVDFRAMTNACPHNCFHCFTDKNLRTLTLEQIKKIIDQLSEMKAKAIDFLGEGEPTIDPWFFEIIEYTSSKGIVPVVFTDGATKLRDRNFVQRLKSAGASVCPKCDSLFNSQYQNWVVGDKTNKFFNQRNEAVELLIDEGFNEISQDGTTRLGFDMVVSSKNIAEVPKTLRFCRKNNIWVIFAFYLPSGRSASKSFDAELQPSEKAKQKMREQIEKIDREEFGYNHTIWNNFATMPCIERVQIYGDGRVSPCPGNETIVGKAQDYSIKELHQKILEKFPGHNPASFNGHCLYRSKINCPYQQQKENFPIKKRYIDDEK